ncbi:hypothetical protein GCM10028822_41510 [Hymenobacter terrigena]
MTNISDTLTRLSALDLATRPYDEVKELIKELERFGAMQFSLHAGKTITRGRPNDIIDGRPLSFTRADQLSYKPQKFNSTYQRASTPFKTMFYGSVIPENLEEGDVAIERMISVSEASSLLRNVHRREISPELKKETITFGQWVVTNDIPLLSLCYYKPLLQNNSLGRELYAEFEKGTQWLPEPLRTHTRSANTFFAEQFAKPSHEFRGDFEYMLSAIFAETTVEKGLAGVHFPSVKAQGMGFNVAISPEVTDRSLRLDKVLECTLYERDGHFFLDSDKFARLSPGETNFELQAITDPRYHSTEDEINRWFDEQKRARG